MTNTKAPHFVLAAIKRIYSELSDLIGDDWQAIQPKLDKYIAALEAAPNNYLAMTEVSKLLWAYKPVQQRLNDEIKVQEILQANIAAQMETIARDLDVDPQKIDGLTAAAYAHLRWQADSETIPPQNDTRTRSVTMKEGGIGGAQSVKFENMSLDLGDFSKIAAGFVTTGFDILDKPHPLLVAAGVLLTVYALHDTMKIELSEQEASIFWGMVRATGNMKGAGLHEETILKTTNTERATYGLEPLNQTQIRYSLTKLVQIKCVSQDGETYRIVENYKIDD